MVHQKIKNHIEYCRLKHQSVLPRREANNIFWKLIINRLHTSSQRFLLISSASPIPIHCLFLCDCVCCLMKCDGNGRMDGWTKRLQERRRRKKKVCQMVRPPNSVLVWVQRRDHLPSGVCFVCLFCLSCLHCLLGDKKRKSSSRLPRTRPESRRECSALSRPLLGVHFFQLALLVSFIRICICLRCFPVLLVMPDLPWLR